MIFRSRLLTATVPRRFGQIIPLSSPLVTVLSVRTGHGNRNKDTCLVRTERYVTVTVNVRTSMIGTVYL